ncbi:MAG: serine acetyltransferase [Sulfobacillus sp.]|nr:serine acetyltransferase [Sulfobacillus sp.]
MMNTSDQLQHIVHQLAQGETAVSDLGQYPITRDAVRRFIREAESLLFPRCFSQTTKTSPVEGLGQLLWRLTSLIHRVTPHDCPEPEPCPQLDSASKTADLFMRSLPEIQRVALTDAQAAYEGDPAARGLMEIITTYPGFHAILVYRLAHILHLQGVPLLPRIMTEVAHSETGIDIHPGAEIGEYFFIDHGTGVVIGETTQIGDRVTLYQGVTLGALNFPHDQNGQIIRGTKRHPTIEDDVVIYSGATILGGSTVIGRQSVIGGNVWLTRSVPPYSKVTANATISLRTREES